jgi:hypothetical protein
MNTALAKGSHVLSRVLANIPDATALHVYDGRQLEAWMAGNSERRSIPKQASRARRRPSPKRTLKAAKELGFDVAMAPDGTMKFVHPGEDNNDTDSYWDRKLQ